MIQMAYNHCPHVVAVSKQVKDDLVNNFGVRQENISIINNFVNKDFILEKTKDHIDDFIFDSKKKYILNVGRFSVQKAQWKLIKAFSIYLKKAKTDVELILMGAGDFTEKLVELAKKLKVLPKVHILPFNTNPYKYMARSHLFALSSIYEGFPIVLAEVSSLRIPFIGSEKAVPEEMFDNKKFRENCIFDSLINVPDFSSAIYKEEQQLAQLLQKGIENEEFRKNILLYTQKWEDQNDKTNQFLQYDKLIGISPVFHH